VVLRNEVRSNLNRRHHLRSRVFSTAQAPSRMIHFAAVHAPVMAGAQANRRDRTYLQPRGSTTMNAMKTPRYFPLLLLAPLLWSGCATHQGIPAQQLDLANATIRQLQDAMSNGELTSKELVTLYLERIDAMDQRGPAINSILQINPEALTIADALDRERRESGPRGPLHGIPILLKDNIDTADQMETTAGSLALLGTRPERDAFIVERLRESGAVILGKTKLSE
jgi:hypothetical protein